LSLSSRCYAKRTTREIGLTTIEYAQADIMQLDSIGRSFDVISSVGVLHHLADPTAGLLRLLSLLRPGGFMRLGLYSESARQAVVEARQFIEERGYASTADDIRRCRQDLIDGDEQFAALTVWGDFYSTSECRDLLFHVQEHRFMLPQLKEALRGVGLNFIGFSVDSSVTEEYGARFPDDKAQTDLDNWHRFEIEFPDTFAAMYDFWVQKPMP
jgi:SAM-dependent methyltransferase